MEAQMPLIGMFMNGAESDREIENRKEAFLQGLGPMTGLHIAACYGGAVYSTYPKKARDLVNLEPDLYFAGCWPALQALIKVSAPGPVVFAGIFNSPNYALSQLGSNIYGFASYGADLCAQWPGLLKQIAPSVTKAAVIYDKDPARLAHPQMYPSIKDAAKQVGIDVTEIDVRLSDPALEDAISNFKNSGGVGGLIVLGSTLTGVRRETIIKLAQLYELPAIYPNRLYVKQGGLISRGVDLPDLYRSAGGYAKQILNGTPTTPMIVQNPKYETAVNGKTAAALGLTVPSTADLVIQ
jgi:putative tryptophan/tyrosine transport system substrate-binding protein